MSNQITIRGRLADDFLLRFSPSGTAWATTSVVSARAVKKGDQWEEKDTTFLPVKVFGKQAEQIAESLRKGDAVTIVGRMVQENWETDGGDKRSRLVVMCDEVAATIRHHQVKVQRMTREQATTTSGGGGGGRVAPVNDPWAA